MPDFRRVCFGLLLSLLTSAGLAAEPLQGTQPLEMTEPLDVVMVAGIDRFCLKELAASIAGRAQHWKRDTSSAAAYEKSIAPNRESFRTIIGAVDKRLKPSGFELVGTLQAPALIAKGKGHDVYNVRWQVLEGITGEGLLFVPHGTPRARVIAVPDADWTPETFSRLENMASQAEGFVQPLVASGCEVLVPTILSREDTYAGNPAVAMTNQTHREYVYRQAFELGRHIIGYEVQKILSAVDNFEALNTSQNTSLPIAVAGVGEGGLLALYSAALDTRITATLVSGYFGPRENVWQEPIYRNVWALLREFGDAEIAGLIAPRVLIVEAAPAPESAGPPEVKPGRRGGAAPGFIKTPDADAVAAEVNRAKPVFESLKVAGNLKLSNWMTAKGDRDAIAQLLATLKVPLVKEADVAKFEPHRKAAPDRQRLQVAELVDYTQHLLLLCAGERDKFWNKADRTNAETWAKTSEYYRDYVYDELIGRLPSPTVDPAVRSRQVMDEPGFTAYEVVIDVYPDVIAGGVLLLPKNMKPDEKRPVVVCQHGLEGEPMDTIRKDVPGFAYYKAFAAELANRGFITFAPQNPYRGKDLFRTLQRKSNPLKRSLFSYIIPQHQRILDFLKTLPNVDEKRMGFYGLSYGGKTAVRVPPLLKDYALSICSADFDEWVMKISTVHAPFSYVFTGEYEIFEWNMGHVANYAELSSLMTPRPFMVERGHKDGVAPDEWVLWEYSKVYRHYDYVGLRGKTEIEVFDGPHTINGDKTYEFLHRHLHWPAPGK